MAKAKTYFEQVPVILAKKIAEREQLLPQRKTVSCVICGATVELEDCKIDEVGGAVHQECYVEKVASPR